MKVPRPPAAVIGQKERSPRRATDMAAGHLLPVLHYLRQVGGTAGATLADRQLLEHFVRHGDETAFAALVRRHGPMVHGLCRRGLRAPHAARRLGCPLGTVATRLARARQRLRARLAKCGLTVSAGALATSLGQDAASATVPALLLNATVKAASAFAAGNLAGAGVLSTNVI